MLSARTGHELLAYLAGKMRKYYIRVLPGDHVRVQISPYDLTRGRIIRRFSKPPPKEEIPPKETEEGGEEAATEENSTTE